ncbi:MAG: flagellar biosynthesis protein FlhB [Elioraea sp.]|nr:flagellar biosynthesis protein FlhB [Elioraea sp.]
MAEENESAGERTEAPTQRRLERAREEGQVALSKDVATVAALAGGTVGLALVLPPAAASLFAALLPLVERPHTLEPHLFGPALGSVATRSLILVLGVALLALVVGGAATLLQTGFLVSAKPLVPRLSKISPAAGLKRLVSPENLMEFVKGVSKLVLLAAVAAFVLWDAPSRYARTVGLEVGPLLRLIVADSLRLVVGLLAALAVIAALDFLWTRHRHLERLRMSRRDIKEELRQSEGDPEVKARLKRIRAERARRRMMDAVPRATVVVTNPTHYAVALHYDRAKEAAPKVVAKGVDHMAARIRAIAEQHRVPIVSNPPLARALYTVDLDREIPEEHYAAVAEVIAYVWRLKGLVARHAG